MNSQIHWKTSILCDNPVSGELERRASQGRGTMSDISFLLKSDSWSCSLYSPVCSKCQPSAEMPGLQTPEAGAAPHLAAGLHASGWHPHASWRRTISQPGKDFQKHRSSSSAIQFCERFALLLQNQQFLRIRCSKTS